MAQLVENKRRGPALIANKPVFFAESYKTVENRINSLWLLRWLSRQFCHSERGACPERSPAQRRAKRKKAPTEESAFRLSRLIREAKQIPHPPQAGFGMKI
jgi:hypothetical protein